MLTSQSKTDTAGRAMSVDCLLSNSGGYSVYSVFFLSATAAMDSRINLNRKKKSPAIACLSCWPTRADSEPFLTRLSGFGGDRRRGERRLFGCRAISQRLSSPQVAQKKRHAVACPSFGLPGSCPVESLKSCARLCFSYECLPLVEKDFWPLTSGKQGTISMQIVA